MSRNRPDSRHRKWTAFDRGALTPDQLRSGHQSRGRVPLTATGHDQRLGVQVDGFSFPPTTPHSARLRSLNERRDAVPKY